MTNRTQRGGCFRVLKVFWTMVFFFALLILIGINLVFSNIFGETCGWSHPHIFEIEASIIEDTGQMLTSPFTELPENASELNRFFEYQASFNANVESESNDFELDTYLRIYDASGATLLASNDDFSAETYSAGIEGFGLPETTSVIVEVGTFSDASEGTYLLRVAPVDGPISAPSPQVAERIENVYQTGYELDNNGDSDTETIFAGERVAYTMTLEANQAYSFLTETAELIDVEELDTYLRIYDSSGNIILAENDDDEFGFSSGLTNFGVPDTQTIIIEVATFQDSLAGDITLEVTPVDSEIEFAELGVEDSSATVIDSGITLNSNGDSVQGFIDVAQRIRYTMLAEGGQAYEIRIYGTNAFTSGPVVTDEGEDTGRAINRSYAFSQENNAANQWASCIQFFGFVSDTGYVINLNGFIWFVAGTEAEAKLAEVCSNNDAATFRDFLAQCVQANIRVSIEGRLIFFVLLAILVVSLPIFIVDSLEGQREGVWYVFLMLVVVQATTTAMLFLHLGQVSGIEALSEFGYSIFGGITTGAALVFIAKVAERAKDHTSMIIPPDNER